MRACRPPLPGSVQAAPDRERSEYQATVILLVIVRPSRVLSSVQVRWYSELKDTLSAMIPNVQKDVKEFRAKYGETKVGEVDVNMVSDPSEVVPVR